VIDVERSAALTRSLQPECPGVVVEVCVGTDNRIRFLAYAERRDVAERTGFELARDAQRVFGVALRESAEWMEDETLTPWVVTVTARVSNEQRRTGT
jgi:hypothetical protein